MAVQPAIGKGDTNWVTLSDDKECRERLEDCFDERFFSENDLEVVQAAFLYLDNISLLSHHYSLPSFLKRLSAQSKTNKADLFLYEAMIYFHGEHVEQDMDKAISILESSKYLSYNNPEHLLALGQAYYVKFMSTGRSNEDYYEKAKSLLLKAYEFDDEYMTRALAMILFLSNDKSDFDMAGRLFKHFADTGNSSDIKRYKFYLDTLQNLQKTTQAEDTGK